MLEQNVNNEVNSKVEEQMIFIFVCCIGLVCGLVFGF